MIGIVHDKRHLVPEQAQRDRRAEIAEGRGSGGVQADEGEGEGGVEDERVRVASEGGGRGVEVERVDVGVEGALGKAEVLLIGWSERKE